MAHYEPPHQDLRCLQIQLFSYLVVKELKHASDYFFKYIAKKEKKQNCYSVIQILLLFPTKGEGIALFSLQILLVFKLTSS